MSIWFTLYRCELKKIFLKRFVVVSLAAIYGFIAFGLSMPNFGDAYLDGIPYQSNAELVKLDIENARALSGHPIDNALLSETMSVYRKYHDLKTGLGVFPSAEQKQIFVSFYLYDCRPYKAIFDYCKKALNLWETALLSWEANENRFYADIQSQLRDKFSLCLLSDEEIKYWEQAQEKLEKPITFRYCGGYTNLLSIIYISTSLLILLAGLALSGVFSDEHATRCDQLILSCKNGRGMLYFAKLLAGFSFAALSVMGLILIALLVVFQMYDADGFDAPLQLFRPLYPYPISIGKFTILSFALLLLVILSMSLTVMLLSLCFRRGMVPMAVTMTLVMMGMFVNVPENHRLMSKIWDWLPSNYLFASNLFDLRLVSLFGKQFVSWQVLPVIYIALDVGLAFLGKAVYNCSQAGG